MRKKERTISFVLPSSSVAAPSGIAAQWLHSSTMEGKVLVYYWIQPLYPASRVSGHRDGPEGVGKHKRLLFTDDSEVHTTVPVTGHRHGDDPDGGHACPAAAARTGPAAAATLSQQRHVTVAPAPRAARHQATGTIMTVTRWRTNLKPGRPGAQVTSESCASEPRLRATS